jgi:hypothetical protein
LKKKFFSYLSSGYFIDTGALIAILLLLLLLLLLLFKFIFTLEWVNFGLNGEFSGIFPGIFGKEFCKFRALESLTLFLATGTFTGPGEITAGVAAVLAGVPRITAVLKIELSIHIIGLSEISETILGETKTSRHFPQT